MSTERTATSNALTALLRVSDLGIDARRPLTAGQIAMIAAWRALREALATATARGDGSVARNRQDLWIGVSRDLLITSALLG